LTIYPTEHRVMSLRSSIWNRQLVRSLQALRSVWTARSERAVVAEPRQTRRHYAGGSDESRIAAGSLGRRWQERETSQENMYFSKEDELVLKRLAAKMARQVAPTEEQLAQEREAIQGVLQKHGIKTTPELVEELVKLRHGV